MKRNAKIVINTSIIKIMHLSVAVTASNCTSLLCKKMQLKRVFLYLKNILVDFFTFLYFGSKG